MNLIEYFRRWGPSAGLSVSDPSSTTVQLAQQEQLQNQVPPYPLRIDNSSNARSLLLLPEILDPVFSQLDCKSILAVRLVCKQWGSIARHCLTIRALWKHDLSNLEKKSLGARMTFFDALEVVCGSDDWIKRNGAADEDSDAGASNSTGVSTVSTKKHESLQDLIPEPILILMAKDNAAAADADRIRLRKLTLRMASDLCNYLDIWLPLFPLTTSLELNDLVKTEIRLYDILKALPNLRSLTVEYAMSGDVSWNPQQQGLQIPSQEEYINSVSTCYAKITYPPFTHKFLEILILRHVRTSQAYLVSLLEALPNLRELEVRLMKLCENPDTEELNFNRQRLHKTLARSAPLLESFHFSLYHHVLTLEEAIDLRDHFPSLKSFSAVGKDMDDQGRGNQMIILNHYANYLTKLEILCYTESQCDKFVEALHRFLCSARHLKHLIAPKVRMWAEYMDMEPVRDTPDDSSSEDDNNQVPDQGYYRPRSKRIPKSFRWRVHMRTWACRDLETLHLGFCARFGYSNEAKCSRVVFGYISRHCPNLKDLSVVRTALNLKLEGGLCLLTRLKDLERLKIVGYTRYFNLEPEDVNWIGHKQGTTSTRIDNITTTKETIPGTGSVVVADARLKDKEGQAIASTPSVVPISPDNLAKVFAKDEEWYTSQLSKGQHRKKRIQRMKKHERATPRSTTETSAPSVPSNMKLPFKQPAESAYRCWPCLRSFVLAVDPEHLFKNKRDLDLIPKLRPDINFCVRQYN
ncbi:hypothetical protein BGZ54_008424 [Gamsiella multidivaricata]|nr:hypothetical protein BGZ54_008424 [Gamsiella multidivaricata]